MTDDFYRAFEDKFRGDQATIEQRLTVYWPHVEPLTRLYTGLPVLDLGCGRGEWLRLMRQHGVKAKGIDVDSGMLSACQKDGLDVIQADALDYLSQQPDASVMVISAFHVVEHLPFPTLRAWLDQALRVLVPGGLLILETPNPENIQVGSCNFYLDPTHQRPLPPPLLAFAVEHHGFVHDRTLRLQEDPQLQASEQAINLEHVLAGASPDYAVLGRKPGQPDAANTTAVSGGVDSLTLARLWQSQQHQLQHQLQHQQMQLAQRIQVLTEQQSQASAEMQAMHAHALQQASQLRQQLLDMHASSSWRITAPLRWIGAQMRCLREDGISARLKAALRKLMRKTYNVVQRHPRLKSELRRIASASGLLPLGKVWLQKLRHGQQPAPIATVERTNQHEPVLRASARKTLEELQQAIQAGKEIV